MPLRLRLLYGVLFGLFIYTILSRRLTPLAIIFGPSGTLPERDALPVQLFSATLDSRLRGNDNKGLVRYRFLKGCQVRIL